MMTTRRVYHVSILVPGVYVGKGGGACKVFQNVERGGACTKCGGFCATQTLQGIEAPSRSLKSLKVLLYPKWVAVEQDVRDARIARGCKWDVTG